MFDSFSAHCVGAGERAVTFENIARTLNEQYFKREPFDGTLYCLAHRSFITELVTKALDQIYEPDGETNNRVGFDLL